MDDLNKSRTGLIIASAAMILIFGGLAEFDRVVNLPLLGIKLSNPAVLPWVLGLMWAYSWHRFTALSSRKYAGEIETMLESQVNQRKLVYRLFPSSKFGLDGEPQIATRAWLSTADNEQFGPGHVIYRREPLSRILEFSYQSAKQHVHFIDQRNPTWGPHLQKGRVGLWSLAYWQCLIFEFSLGGFNSLVQRVG